MNDKTDIEHILEDVHRGLTQRKMFAVAERLNALHPAEIAHVMESLPPYERVSAWALINPKHAGDVLTFVNDEVRSSLIDHTSNDNLVAVTETLPADELADILPDLPENVIAKLLRDMDEQDKSRLESILQYPENTAGGLMSIDSVTIRPDVTLDVIQRYIRFRGQLPENTDTLFVVNRENTLLGALPLSYLLTKDPLLKVSEVYKPEIKSIRVDTNDREIAHLFEKRDLLSAPVVDETQKLLGRITIDDVVDVIRDEAEHSILSQAGLDEEDDMFAPVVRSTRRRAIWLSINLLTALLASWVIGLFSATIAQMVALAVLMPIVASMGGIAGSQTLTLMIRGMAVGQVSKSNVKQLIKREILIGGLNGLLWAAVIGALAFAWFDNLQLGIVLAFAILFNLLVAAIAGASIPLILKRFGADPALAGGVVLTTVTDVVGFFAFLGLAAIFLL
ncbi:MAG TPA: magnesium transporter [Gammaproteobacteria bacterium]|nr:magnesium transporter [Gammaproteobacteria bacterium]